jgi:hypothetical protein
MSDDESCHGRPFNSRASLYQDPGPTTGPISVGGTMRLALREVFEHLGIVGLRPSVVAVEGGAGIQMPGLGSARRGPGIGKRDFPFYRLWRLRPRIA